MTNQERPGRFGWLLNDTATAWFFSFAGITIVGILVGAWVTAVLAREAREKKVAGAPNMYTLVTLYNNNGKTIQQWVTDDVVTLSNGIIVFKPLTADRNLRQVRLSGGTLVVETFNELPKNVEIK